MSFKLILLFASRLQIAFQTPYVYEVVSHVSFLVPSDDLTIADKHASLGKRVNTV